MEVFGGFMVMMSIIGLFLAVIWLIMPFVVFAIKGKQDRTLELVEALEKRLSSMDEKLMQLQREKGVHGATYPAEPDASAPDHGTIPPVIPLA